MRRWIPLRKMLELIGTTIVASTFVAGIGFFGEKAIVKLNAKANADIRTSWMMESIADSNKRIAKELEAIARAMDHRKLPQQRPRPSILTEEEFQELLKSTRAINNLESENR